MERARTVGNASRRVLVAPMAEVLFQLGEWRRRRQIRKSFGMTTDSLLRDIGLTADDLLEALDAPLDDDSSDALLKAALARAGNW